ncbi:unnamed protein product [Pedinophyceae sp. YPF-701]|nr:unnamed protein product [Pedinophyceae sp. YPF-701]
MCPGFARTGGQRLVGDHGRGRAPHRRVGLARVPQTACCPSGVSRARRHGLERAARNAGAPCAGAADRGRRSRAVRRGTQRHRPQPVARHRTKRVAAAARTEEGRARRARRSRQPPWQLRGRARPGAPSFDRPLGAPPHPLLHGLERQARREPRGPAGRSRAVPRQDVSARRHARHGPPRVPHRPRRGPRAPARSLRGRAAAPRAPRGRAAVLRALAGSMRAPVVLLSAWDVGVACRAAHHRRQALARRRGLRGGNGLHSHEVDIVSTAVARGRIGYAELAGQYRAAITELRRKLMALGVTPPPGLFDDAGGEFLRHLSAFGVIEGHPRKDAIDKAAAQIKGMLEWRARYTFMPQAELVRYKKLVRWVGRDAAARRPTLFVDLAAVLEGVPRQEEGELMRAVVAQVEHAVRRRLGRPPARADTITVLVSCEGLTLVNATRLLVTLRNNLIPLLSQAYPARLGALYLVAPPRWSGYHVRALKSMLHPQTRSKVHAVQPEEVPALLMRRRVPSARSPTADAKRADAAAGSDGAAGDPAAALAGRGVYASPAKKPADTHVAARPCAIAAASDAAAAGVEVTETQPRTVAAPVAASLPVSDRVWVVAAACMALAIQILARTVSSSGSALLAAPLGM